MAKSIKFSIFAIFIFNYACIPIQFEYPEIESSILETNQNNLLDIKNLLSQYYPSTTITDDVCIEGWIAHSDIEGNFYKELYIEDSTGAVLVSINYSPISERFGKGRAVGLKLKGLTYDIKLGVPTLFRLEQPLPKYAVDSFLYHSSDKIYNPKPIALSLNSQLKSELIGRYVELSPVTFKNAGEAFNHNATEFQIYLTPQIIESNIVLRISVFAQFSNEVIPHNPCKVRGILTKYNNKWQLIISKYSDIIVGSA